MKKLATIQVPCSTSNIGPGFDCIGLALKKYITTEIYVKKGTKKPTITATYIKSSCHTSLQLSQDFQKKGDNEVFITSNTENRIIKAIYQVVNNHCSSKGRDAFEANDDIELRIRNEIPIGVGLGSSGAATITGILIGGLLCETNLSKEMVYKLAYTIEGHPDNVTPSIMGGCTISMADIDYIKPKAEIFDELDILVFVPDTKVSTEDARKALPLKYARSDVIFTIQRCSSLVALLGLPVEDVLQKPKLFQEALGDVIHQQYRAALMPGTPEFLGLGEKLKDDSFFFGTAISGAGPSVLFFYRKGSPNLNDIKKEILECFEKQNKKILESYQLIVDKEGYKIILNK